MAQDAPAGFCGTLVTYQNIEGLSGTDGIDSFYGSASGDVLLAGAGDDFIYGNEGNDWLSGGLGDDTLGGGDGADVFDYRLPEDWSVLGNESVADFGYDSTNSINTTLLTDAANLDSINGDVLLFQLSSLNGFVAGPGFVAPSTGHYSTLEDAYLTLGTSATADHAQFVFDNISGELYFDADGTGMQDMVPVTNVGAVSDTEIGITGLSFGSQLVIQG
jgi:Ca2+-binding RTX toxin-like protein